MDGKLAIAFIFLFTSILTIYLLLRRRYVSIIIGVRQVQIDMYFLGALLGPVFIIAFGILSYSQIVQGLEGSGGLNPFGVLVLFFSMVFISIFLDITGFFEYCARVALKYSSGSGRRLYFSFYLIVSILTIFTSNDVIILTFTPFIYYFTKNVGIDSKPFLIAEFFAANTWSMMLYIGNPTNIVLATAFNLRFDIYTKWMFFPSLLGGIVNMLLLYYLFRKRINQPLVHMKIINPADAIKDKFSVLLGLFFLGGFIISIAIGPYFGINIWIISLVFALTLLLILLIRDCIVYLKKEKPSSKCFMIVPTIKKLPLSIIPFVLSLFITVEALRIYGITKDIGIFFSNISGTSKIITIFINGFSSTFTSNILNNIPMTVAYVPIIRAMTPLQQLPAMYATAIGSNLGANITPIGALAGIMWINILRDKKVHISFKEFIKYGLIVTPLTLITCLGILVFEFTIFSLF